MTFPDGVYAVTRTWKTDLLLKWQFKNTKWMKGICYVTPTLGRYAGYGNKQSHNRMID